MSNHTLNRNKHLSGYQSLEDRRLLAGNVTVFENLHLYMRGDTNDNQIELVVDGDQLRINGLNGTTINFQDSYVVEGSTVTESGVTFTGGLRANFGQGSDHLEIRDAQFEDFSIIYGGDGDDQIDLIDSHFLDQALIQTYFGDDTINIDGSQFDDIFWAITLDGEDAVNLVNSKLNGGSIVATGDHSDFIHSDGSHYLGDLNLILPLDGDDTVQLDNPVIGEFQLGVYLGDGNDGIGGDLRQSVVEGTIVISGQTGLDENLGMSMSDEASEATTLWSIEKAELVFESPLGGIENVSDGATSYTTTFEPGGELESTYIEQYATPVLLDTTKTVTQIEWSGTYFRDYLANRSPKPEPLPDLGDSFFIEVYEGAEDGAPDVDSVVKFEASEANRIAAGSFEDEYYGTIPVYAYHAEVDFTMEAGKQYWISIYTEVDEEEYSLQNHWQWGYGVDYEARSTVFNQGEIHFENDWRWRDNPYFIEGIEMDLRLRS